MVRLVQEDDVDRLAMEQREKKQAMRMNRSSEEGADAARQPVTREGAKVGRNQPCPCGSGKKYKRCCGRAK